MFLNLQCFWNQIICIISVVIISIYFSLETLKSFDWSVSYVPLLWFVLEAVGALWMNFWSKMIHVEVKNTISFKITIINNEKTLLRPFTKLYCTYMRNIFVDHMSEDVRLEARAEAERLTRLIIRHARMSRSRKTSTPFTYNLWMLLLTTFRYFFVIFIVTFGCA